MLKKLIALFAIVGLTFASAFQQLKVDAASTNFTFTSVNFYSTYWGFQSGYVGLSGSRLFVMEIEGCDTAGCQTYQSPGYGYANIQFYDGAYNVVGTHYLNALISTTDGNGVYTLDADVLGYVTTPSYFRVTIPYAYVGSNPYLSLVNNSYYDLWPSDYVKTVKFMSGLSVVYTTQFVGYVDDYPSDPTPPSGYDFTGWYTNDGTLYDFQSVVAIPDSWYINDVFYLYAKYAVSPSDEDLPTTPGGEEYSPIMVLLAAYGLNNTGGQTFVYVVFLVLINGLVYWFFKPSVLISATLSLGLTAMFMYLGILPLAVSIIMLSIMILVLLMSFRGGLTVNE